jgi:hypothetical protein
MNDYQLERLNTRSFEQLVQALALAVMGPQVAVYGDGPDGGREATFVGTVDYPKGGKRWKGSGIVQAKFKQQPFAVAGKNADWALAELEAEFAKLKPKRKGRGKAGLDERECPDYYVFATNVALSPALRAGGKDRVTAFLERCKRSHGLVGYALWDSDQVRRMLDQQEAIRTSFLPFLLPGDVLAEVMRSLKPRRADFAAIMLRHLQLELLDDQFARLSQGGYVSANRVSLSTVFVDLPIDGAADLEPPEPEQQGAPQRITFLQRAFAEASRVLRPSYRPRSSPVGPGSARSLIPGRCVVVGGPGQGKTTVGVFACQLMRAALLREAGHTYDGDVKKALDAVSEQAQALPPLKTLRYPLRVDLKRLAEALAAHAPERCNTLLEFLTRQIADRTGSGLDVEDFRLWLRSYPWLLVLDGLDEVPASSNRARMLDAVNDFVRVEAHLADADLMVVATTRPQGYSDEFDPSNYAHLNLMPLLPEEAVHYGTRLAHARHPGAQRHVSGLMRKLEQATRNPATARLMESPLQVTIMLSLIELGGYPPEQRWQLFNQYYDTIFKREKERDTAFSALLREYEADIHWIHRRAGWVLQQRNAEAGKTAARLSHEEFDDLVHLRLIRRGHKDDAALAALVGQMRKAATDRLVLLVGNTAEDIGFEIRSLQEFMAAEHSFDGDDEVVRRTLQLIAPHAYWRNVFLFMAGRIFFNKEVLVDSVLGICNRLNEPLEDAALARTLAGSRLAMALLEDDACRKQPANTRQLARLAARLMDLPLADDRARLGALFAREAGEVLAQELNCRLEGANASAEAWMLGLDLARGEQEWAQALVKRHFPWCRGDVERLFWAYGVNGPRLGDFLWGEVARNLRRLSPVLVDRLADGRRDDGGELARHIDATVAKGIGGLMTYSNELLLWDHDGRLLSNALPEPGKLGCYLALRMEGQDLSDAHPDWQQLAAAATLAQRPSIKTLCEVLPLVLAADSVLKPKYFLPWQFNVCIDAARAGMSLDAIIADVQSGKLGGPVDWLRWEGLESCSLQDIGQGPDLLSVSDRSLAGVFCRGGWRHSTSDDREALRFMAEVRRVLPAFQPDARLATSLVRLACFSMLKNTGRVFAENATGVEEVRQFVEQARAFGYAVGRELVAAVLTATLPSEEKISLLSGMCAKAPPNYWLDFSGTGRAELSDAWSLVYVAALETGQELSVLTAIGQLPPMACMHVVSPEVLRRLGDGTETQRHVAKLLKLALGCWETDGLEAMVAVVRDLQESQPQWLHDWIQFLEMTGQPGTLMETFLLSLANESETAQGPPLATWLRLLNKFVDRRPAPTALPNPLRLP